MDCVICLAQPQNPQTLPCCSKAFCADCLSNWVNVRNCCPLCITPLGTIHKNELSNASNQQFDNGSLMLENQMANVLQRYSYLQILVQAKTQASYNHKNVFPKYRLQHAQRDMQRIHFNIEIAQIALTENDRVTATNSIQAITELIYGVQQILNGNSQVQYMEYSDDDDEYQEDNFYEQEERLYEMAELQQRKNNSKGNKRKM